MKRAKIIGGSEHDFQDATGKVAEALRMTYLYGRQLL
jgi:hypothetical protein